MPGGIWRDLRLHTFPWAQKIEITELLNQMNRLIHNPPLGIVIAHLNVTRQREILAQRVPLKAVIC